MIRNHPLMFTVLALALTVTASAWLAVLSQPNAPSAVNVTDEVLPIFENAPASGASGEDYGYILKEHNGKLAVFEKDKNDPNMIFDIYVSTLPDYDKGQLAQGVKVKDYESLVVLIEDYIS